jgi:hypothetical protein
MRFAWVPAFAMTLSALVSLSSHADDTFTQLGHWSCTTSGHTQVGSEPIRTISTQFTCPPVSFPQKFGGTPNLVLLNTAGKGPYGKLAGYQELSPDSFRPIISCVGYPDNPCFGITLSGDWIASGPVLIKGNAVAKYIVLTVIYAPPGTNGGHSTSSVSYQAGSTTGTLTSASQTFKTANSLSFEGSGGFLGSGGGAGLSFDVSKSTTDSQSLEIKKSTTSTISRTGPSQDGINHDQDAIYLLLNPTVTLALSSSSAAWLLANSSSPIQYVYVGWLNGHAPMPSNVEAVLTSAGITSADYPDILARDPLASGSMTPDPSRFVSLNTTFPYEQPYSASDPVPTITTTISDSSTVSTGTSSEDTYKVGLSISATGGFLDFAKATLKDTSSWEWTNKSSTSSTTGGSQSASVTIGGPAYGYNGPTVIRVYIDTLYRSFAFALVPAGSLEVAVTGKLTDVAGKPIGATEVTLQEGAAKYRTFTNTKGEYSFFGHITGPATIQGGGVTRELPQATSTTRESEIKLQ